MSANGTLSTASAGGELNSDYTIKDDGAAKKTTSSATPGISTMAVGGSCTISVTDPRYGLTCRKASTYDCNNVCGGSAYYYCPTGSSSPSCSSSQYEYDVGVQKCTSGSSTNSTHCYTCKNCSWVCPDNTYTTAPNGYYLSGDGSKEVCNGDKSKTRPSGSNVCYSREACTWTCPKGTQSPKCGTGYYQTGTADKYCDGDPSQTNGTCYECTKCPTTVTCGSDEVCTAYSPCDSSKCTSCGKKSCEEGGYFSSTQSGQHCSPEPYASKTCYSCHTPDYSWCPSGFQASTCGTGYYAAETDDKECRYCSAKSGTCYKCAANTCASEGYEASIPSGKTCKEVEIKSGSGTKTCYKDCVDDTKYYVLEYGLNASYNSERYTGYYATMKIWTSEIDSGSPNNSDAVVLFDGTVWIGDYRDVQVPEGARLHIYTGEIYNANGVPQVGALGTDHSTMTGNYSYYIDVDAYSSGTWSGDDI